MWGGRMIFLNSEGTLIVELGDGDVAIGAGTTQKSEKEPKLKIYVRFGQLMDIKDVGEDLLSNDIKDTPVIMIVFKNKKSLEILQKTLDKARELESKL
jgi:hypothetical protein